MSKQTTTNESTGSDANNHQVMVTIYRPDGSIHSETPNRMFGSSADHAMLTKAESLEETGNKIESYDPVARKVTLIDAIGIKTVLSFDKKRRVSNVADPAAVLIAKANRK